MTQPNTVKANIQNTKTTATKTNAASTKTVTPSKQAANTHSNPTGQSSTQANNTQTNSIQTNNTQANIDQWVLLHEAPSDFSHNEALLLCELNLGEWVSWVPGYGEILLNLNQFESKPTSTQN